MKPNLVLSLSFLSVCCLLLTSKPAEVQSSPFAPTDPNNPIKLVIDRLNSPVGIGARTHWNIDTAIWHEPVAVVDSNGTSRLVTPAYGEIHVSSVPFAYPSGGAMPTNPGVPSKIRCLIPRTYGTNRIERLVIVAPTGETTENNFEGTIRNLAPILRKGYLVCSQNSYTPTLGPHTKVEFGPRLGQGTRYAFNMLFARYRFGGMMALGLVTPTYTYAYGFGRGVTAITNVLESRNNPFNGALTGPSDEYFVPRVEEMVTALKQLHAVNPADETDMHSYFRNIGRNMTITRSDGTTRTGVISAVINADYRFFFSIPPTAQINFPSVPGFDTYGINFGLTATSFDSLVSGNPNANPPTLNLSSIRQTLLDADPAYIADVDAGIVLLRDWDPARRPMAVQKALAALTPSGVINNTKMLKLSGVRDPGHYVTKEIEYIERVIANGSSRNLRYYFDPSGGSPLMVEETFVNSIGGTTSLGWKLNDLDALTDWVETGAEPGYIVMLNSTDATSTSDAPVKGAHQYGFQNDPRCYFRVIAGAPLLDSCSQAHR